MESSLFSLITLALIAFLGFVCILAFHKSPRAALPVLTMPHFEHIELHAVIEEEDIVSKLKKPTRFLIHSAPVNAFNCPTMTNRDEFVACVESNSQAFTELLPVTSGSFLVYFASRNSSFIPLEAYDVYISRFRWAVVLASKVSPFVINDFMDKILQLLDFEVANSLCADFLLDEVYANYVMSIQFVNMAPERQAVLWNRGILKEMIMQHSNNLFAPLQYENIAGVPFFLETQLVHHATFSEEPHYNDTMKAYTIDYEVVRRFILDNKWESYPSINDRLYVIVTRISDVRFILFRIKVFNFLIVIPDLSYCPVYVITAEGKVSSSNAFIRPSWGGLSFYCPSESMYGIKQLLINSTLVHHFSEILLSQLRQLYDIQWMLKIPANWLSWKSKGTISLWEIDLLYLRMRRHMVCQISERVRLLVEMKSLNEDIPVSKEVSDAVSRAFQEAAKAATQPLTQSLHTIRKALRFASDASFHPTLQNTPHFSQEHLMGIFMPFFVPFLVTMAVNVAQHIVRLRRRQRIPVALEKS